jgi:putative transposase
MTPEERYPTDLTDAQWAVLEPLIPPPKPGGRPRTVSMRQVVNAILYIDRAGCQWRMLPREYPTWKTVYWYFTRWQDDGTWEQLTDALRRQLRRQLGRDDEPSAAILDSQSVKTTQRGALVATTPTRK